MISILKKLFKKRTSCPYCGYDFHEMPKRKRKCPDCQQTVYRKKQPTDRTLRLVTKEKAQEIEKKWDRYYQEK